MLNFCPQCGVKLEREYKFCPSCGFEISKLDFENIKEPLKYPDGIKKEKVICQDCGAANDPSNTICIVCGEKLSPVKNTASNEIEKKAAIRRPAQKKSADQEIDNLDKTLSPTNILIIVATVLVLALIVLYFSGTFDEPAAANIQQNSNLNPPVSSGVDLNLLNEINSLEKQVEAEPGNEDLILRLANLQNDAGLYNKAIPTYNKYLDINPENADARIDMGVAYFNLKNYPAAIEEMERALKYEPNHQIGHLNLGIVNLQSGNLEASEEWLKKAVEIDPADEAGKRAKELLENHF